MKALRLLLALSLLAAAPAWAAVQSKVVTYKDGDATLTGQLYWDDAVKGKRPGVLVVHEWWGLNDYAKHRAEMLAKLGYVAFAADMYGDKKVTRHAEDAKGWMGQITANIDAWQHRAALGLAQLKASKLVDGDRLAAIGYCFGGATVMQMVYAGQDVKGVVSFHGSMPPATPEQVAAMQAAKHRPKVLLEHGDADPFVPAERIATFKDALTQAGVDWEMDVYANTRHSFTNPDAASFGMAALAYNPEADRRSWARMQAFFAELFR